MIQNLNRNETPIRMRNYGRIVQDMISYACTIQNKQERESLEQYIAKCMQQRNLLWNKDQESGLNRVREDILRLSDGVLQCDSPAFQQLLSQSQSTNLNQQKKKRK